MHPSFSYTFLSQFRSGLLYFTFDFSIIFGLGTAGDFFDYHNGRKFSTKDQDNDVSSARCAVGNKGAWWFGDCRTSNLNGVYYYGQNSGYCIKWGAICPAKRAEMKIRPVGF